jgi:excisionase family DNA binding protein
MRDQGRTATTEAAGAATARAADRELPQRMYRIGEVVRMTGLSRSVIYEQLRAGRLGSVYQGRARRVTAAQLDDYIRLLEREAAAEPGR